MAEKRADDFNERRAHLAKLSDQELYERFWSLASDIVDPLRMGFSSREAKAIVDGVIDRGLMGKGAGHVVYKLAKSKNISVREAGVALADGKMWQEAADLFKGGN